MSIFSAPPRLLLAMAMILVSSAGSIAQTVELIGENGAWKAFRSGSGADISCFITSVPVKLEGKYDRNNRDETRVFVTHYGKGNKQGQVSSVAGYRFQAESGVTFTVDGTNFALFSSDTRAWATTPSMDADLVKAMKRGNTLIVTGVSSRGNKTIDTYSLKGFTASMQLIDRTCG